MVRFHFMGTGGVSPLVHPHAFLAGCATFAAAVLVAVAVALIAALVPGLERREQSIPVVFKAVPEQSQIQGQGLRPTSQVLAQESRLRFDTGVGRSVTWVGVELSHSDAIATPILEFPSRHIVQMHAHIADKSGRILDEIKVTRGKWSEFEWVLGAAGVVLDLPIFRSTEPYQILLRVESEGPAVLTARRWARADFRAYVRSYAELGGILLGGLGMFSIFAALVAIRLRDPLYTAFAGWVVAQLAAAGLSSGHAYNWLAQFVPVELHTSAKNLALAILPLFTIILFQRLFPKQLEALGVVRIMQGLVVAWVAICLLALAIPMGSFLPVYWVGAFLSLLYGGVVLAQIVSRFKSSTAIWYSAGLGTFFAGAVIEVAHKSGVISDLPGGLNSVTGALVAAAMIMGALADHMVSERKRRLDAQRAEIKALKAYSGLFERSAAGLVTMSQEANILSYNPAFASLLGVSTPLFGVNLGVVLNTPSLRDGLEVLIASGNKWETSIELPICDEVGPRWATLMLQLAEEKIEGTLVDVTDKKRHQDQLEFVANHDLVTNLGNRYALEQALLSLNQESDLKREDVLIMFDLHKFSTINDLYGQGVGDDLLKKVGGILREMVPPTTPLFRIGGDTFVALLVGVTGPYATRLAHSIVEKIGRYPFTSALSKDVVTLSAYAGAIQCPVGVEPKKTTFALQSALRAAKQKGKGSVVSYHSESKEIAASLRAVELLGEFRERLALERLRHFVQPIVGAVGPNAPVAAESLIRMVDEKGLMVAPAEFVGAVERNGLIHILDRWIFDQSMDWLEANPSSSLKFLSVNCSAASLEDKGYVAHVLGRLKEQPNVAKRICIEVTESVALYEIKRTRLLFEKIRSLNASVALDDFGAGYTSFRYLKELPANVVKIDGEFVRDVVASKATRVVTASVVELAQRLNMLTVAEWAEDFPTIEALAQMGADFVQGFAIAMPRPILGFAELIDDYNCVPDERVRQWLRAGPTDDLGDKIQAPLVRSNLTEKRRRLTV